MNVECSYRRSLTERRLQFSQANIWFVWMISNRSLIQSRLNINPYKSIQININHVYFPSFMPIQVEWPCPLSCAYFHITNSTLYYNVYLIFCTLSISVLCIWRGYHNISNICMYSIRNIAVTTVNVILVK